jgi:hypothetical protein
MKYRTIKECAQDYLMRTHYVDAYGRNVGFDYKYILKRLKTHFPKANTSHKWLCEMAYDLNRSANRRLPVRHRSLRILARGYMRSLLIERDKDGIGLSYDIIIKRVRSRYPLTPKLSIAQMRGHLTRAKVNLPPRPESKKPRGH